MGVHVGSHGYDLCSGDRSDPSDMSWEAGSGSVLRSKARHRDPTYPDRHPDAPNQPRIVPHSEPIEPSFYPPVPSSHPDCPKIYALSPAIAPNRGYDLGRYW